MKFVHIADVHLDIPFKTITERADLGTKRRLEQRRAMQKVINFIKENDIEYLFISGDLYEHEYIRKSTIDFVNSLFEQIPNTQIYISPGNHDPYVKDSYYMNYLWSKNVKIFTDVVEKVENKDVNIYGFGFNNFYMDQGQLTSIQINDMNKINILVTHGDIANSKYNPMNKNELISKGFDYIAIGHIHKKDDTNNIVYPGSLISLGFDELGKHGMIVGEIIDKKLYKQFIPVDEMEFIEKEFDVSNVFSNEELIEKLNMIQTNNDLYKILLVGYRNFPININLDLIQKNIIKIKDNTKLKVDMIENNYTLKGIFVKKLNQRRENGEIDEKTYEHILEIGKQVLESNK